MSGILEVWNERDLLLGLLWNKEKTRPFTRAFILPEE